MIRMARCAVAVAALLMPGAASAQSPSPLPQGNVTLLVAFLAGGPLDVVARVVADKFSLRNSRTVIVENRPGAAGNVGASALARAEPNGLTWLASVDSLWTVNPHMGTKPNFDIDKDITPVTQLGRVVLLLAVNPKVPAKSWQDLLAYSKTKSLNFGSAGIGSPGHLALEYLKTIAPLEAAHVPFRGAAQVTTELLAGNIDGAFIVAGGMIDYVQANQITALAISDTQRFARLPEVPTAQEAGIGGFVARFSNILAVPGNTPEPIKAFLTAEVKAIMAMPDVQERLARIGTEALATDETAARTWIAAERDRWGGVVKARGLAAK